MNNLTVVRGDSETFELTLEGLPEGGLTDADIWFTVRSLVAKRLGDGITVDDPLTGVATITLDAGDTDAAPDHRQTYPYDVQVKFPDGTVTTPVRGLFVVLPDVSRSTT